MTVMTFDEAISYVKSLDVYGSVLGLDNMRTLAEALDNPQDGLKFVHITGTNGKGSTSAFLTSILTEAGYKAGSYNSPAVKSNTDQFRINMEIVPDELYAEAVSLVKEACDLIVSNGGLQPTRFEVETMAAFVMFYLEKCDIVVLETGLGGVDDATNIINTAILHIVTSISMDHADVLGDTLEKIAENKSGIIKTSAPVILYDRSVTDNSEDVIKANAVFEKKCEMLGADLYKVNDLEAREFELSMKGAYQSENATLAIKAAYVLHDLGINISEENIKKGLKDAAIPFRFEQIKVNNQVDIILDGAHNPDGAYQFIKSLELNYSGRECIFITGIFKDKDYQEIARITATRAGKIYIIKNEKSSRSLSKSILAETFRKYNDNVIIADSIRDAISSAFTEANEKCDASGKHPIVCCFGSLSWLNDAKDIIKKLV